MKRPERSESVEASSVSANERIRRTFVAIDASVTRRSQREAFVADALGMSKVILMKWIFSEKIVFLRTYKT